MSEPLFDPSLKKKKAKKQLDLSELDALDAPAAPVESEKAAAAVAEPPSATQAAETIEKVADEPEDLGFGDLKKKKKKKALPLDFELDGTPSQPAAVTGDGVPLEQVSADAADKDAAAAAGDDLDFGDMKKKKKKSKKGAFDLEAFEKEIVGDEGGAEKAGGAGEDDEDLGDDPFRQEGEDEEDKEAEETWHGTDRDYTYQELLGRVFSTLRAQNPALAGEKKKYTMVPPSVLRDGSKKTVFANVVEICKRMHRQPDHVIQYLFSELGTEGSVDGAQRLVIKGRFQPKQIENVLRRYIIEYVTCKTCKSPRTLLKKENRIFFMVCEACGSQRSVTTIKTGFQAQTGRRSKMRAQT